MMMVIICDNTRIYLIMRSQVIQNQNIIRFLLIYKIVNLFM